MATEAPLPDRRMNEIARTLIGPLRDLNELLDALQKRTQLAAARNCLRGIPAVL